MVVRIVRCVVRASEEERWLKSIRAASDEFSSTLRGLIFVTVGTRKQAGQVIGMITSAWESMAAVEAAIPDIEGPMLPVEMATIAESWSVEHIEVVGGWSPVMDIPGAPAD